ncbi:hypothetical protein BDV06DRAFT_207343 [Aspergillus oleicola]
MMPGQTIQDNKEEPGPESPEQVAAQARWYKDALLVLVEMIRRNHPSETFRLIDAIRNTNSVPEAAELIMRLSESENSQRRARESGSRTGGSEGRS